MSAKFPKQYKLQNTTQDTIQNTSQSKNIPKYECDSCGNIMTYDQIKNEVTCTKCRRRILNKLRSPGGIEYSAR